MGCEYDTAEGEHLMFAADYPDSLRDATYPLVERAFIAECRNAFPDDDIDWALYFLSAEETVQSL